MAERLPHEKGFHVSWDQIHRDARALAWRLDGQGPGEDGSWKAIVAITRGGMAPAMIVARELDVRTVDTISVGHLAKLLPRALPIRFLKIDAQGLDLKLVQAMPESLFKRVLSFQLEARLRSIAVACPTAHIWT